MINQLNHIHILLQPFADQLYKLREGSIVDAHQGGMVFADDIDKRRLSDVDLSCKPLKHLKQDPIANLAPIQ